MATRTNERTKANWVVGSEELDRLQRELLRVEGTDEEEAAFLRAVVEKQRLIIAELEKGQPKNPYRERVEALLVREGVKRKEARRAARLRDHERQDAVPREGAAVEYEADRAFVDECAKFYTRGGIGIPGIWQPGVCDKCLDREVATFGRVISKAVTHAPNRDGERPETCYRCAWLTGVRWAFRHFQMQAQHNACSRSESASGAASQPRKSAARDFVLYVLRECRLGPSVSPSDFVEAALGLDEVEEVDIVGTNAHGNQTGKLRFRDGQERPHSVRTLLDHLGELRREEKSPS